MDNSLYYNSPESKNIMLTAKYGYFAMFIVLSSGFFVVMVCDYKHALGNICITSEYTS